jgi:peroxiredoxin
MSLRAVTLSGAPIDLAADRGWKVVYFWSSFCPCVSACEHFTLKPLAEKYRGMVDFYAVVSGSYDLSMPPSELRAKIAARGLPYPVVLDTDHEIVRALGAMITPQTFIIDPQGRVLFNGVPDDSRRYLYRTGKSGASQSYLAEALVQALAGKPVTRPQVRDQGCIIGY